VAGARCAEERRGSSPSIVFHGQEELAVEFAEVVDAAERWDGKRGGAMRTSVAKTLQGLGVLGEGGGQELEGHGLAEGEIRRRDKPRHPATAQQRDNAIAAGQQGAGRETRAIAAAEAGRESGPVGWVASAGLSAGAEAQVRHKAPATGVSTPQDGHFGMRIPVGISLANGGAGRHCSSIGKSLD